MIIVAILEKKKKKNPIHFSPCTKLSAYCRLISFAAYDLQIISFKGFAFSESNIADLFWTVSMSWQS